jgi:hypothetical protein
MKTIDNLIRLHKWQLDEKRRDLVSLEKLREGMQLDLVKLAADLAREAELSGNGNEAGIAFAGWMATALARREKLNASIAEADQRIAAAQEEVNAAFQELKRYEIVADMRNRRAREALARRQTAAMDEAGLEAHRRKAAMG